jgi:hypothetical protein
MRAGAAGAYPRLGNAHPSSRMLPSVIGGAGGVIKRHSMTSSARAKSGGGIVRPIALAVFKLTINSTFVD